MKDNKAFTLIELLAVIVLLGIIGLIAYPVITNIIKNSKEKAYNMQVELIESAAKNWSIDNADKLNKTVKLTVSNLIDLGYIKNDENIIDPRNNDMMNGCVVISTKNTFNQTEYKYYETCPEIVDKIILTITTPSKEKQYDGTALTAGPATISGLVDGDSITVIVTGSQSEVGSSLNSYTIDWGTTDRNKYIVVSNIGTLTVTRK